jgi:hypothetical protein
MDAPPQRPAELPAFAPWGISPRYAVTARDLTAYKAAHCVAELPCVCIVELRIPAGTRVHLAEKHWQLIDPATPYTTPFHRFQKYRSELAVVVGLSCQSGAHEQLGVATSHHDARFVYPIGEYVRPRCDFDKRPAGDSECQSGIHWFLERSEAVEWADCHFVV